MTETFVARSVLRAIVRVEIDKFADNVLAKAIGTALGDMRREMETEFAKKLDDAVKEFAFKGQWSEGVQYRKGNFVSMGGQLFHCDYDCKDARPGNDSINWSLAVKSGRDGRDGRDYRGVTEDEPQATNGDAAPHVRTARTAPRRQPP